MYPIRGIRYKCSECKNLHLEKLGHRKEDIILSIEPRINEIQTTHYSFNSIDNKKVIM